MPRLPLLTVIVLAAAIPAQAARLPAFTPTYYFQCPTGCGPLAPLLVFEDEGVVGLTGSGGKHGHGVVYSLYQAQYRVLHDFETASPSSGFVILGARYYGLLQPTPSAPHGSLWSMGGGDFTAIALPDTVGNGTPRGLVADEAGLLYFVTTDNKTRASGAVFRVTTTGETTLLHEFPKGVPPVGAIPLTIQDGRLWGMTNHGPWMIEPATGRFAAYAPPTGNVFSGIGFADGAMYGTLENHWTAPGNWYRLDRDGTFQTFGEFGGGSQGGLSRGRDGALYATFWSSGHCTDVASIGFIGRIDPLTGTTDDVHDFCFGSDGSPIPGLYPAPGARVFYGATIGDGPMSGGGIFRFEP